MSKSEGIGAAESIEPLTEEEEQAIRAEYDRVRTTLTGRLHPLGENGERLCSGSEAHGAKNWSRPKSLASYPPGYREFCSYCVREWRSQR